MLPAPPPPPVGTRTPTWGLPDVAISFVLFLAIPTFFGVIAALSGLVTVEELEDPTAGLTVAIIVATWIGFAVWPLVIVKWKGTGSLRSDFGLEFRAKDILWALGGIAAFLFVSFVATLAYGVVTGGDQPPSNTDIVDSASSSTLALVVLFVAVGLVTPVVEEVWFRGFFLRAVGKKWGAPVGMVLSSVVFGGLHFRQGIGDLWIVGLLTVYGAILAFIDLRNEGRLGPSIICHAINNSATLLLVTL